MINSTMMAIIILSCSLMILFIILIIGLDGDRFRSRFMRNPTKINVLHTKSGKIWSKLYNLKNGEKDIKDSTETNRIIDWDYAYGHKGISNFYYVDDSAEPVKFDDFKQRLSASELQDLSILWMMAGATDYVPLLLKQIIAILMPMLVIILIIALVSAVLTGINMSNTNALMTHVNNVEVSLKLIKNVTETTIHV
jgi:hypothetical protein